MNDFVLKQAGGVGFGAFSLPEQYGILHGFTMRDGGDSELCPGGLNMALHVGDDKDKVLANRRLVAEALNLDPRRITTCEQVHGVNIAVVDEENVGAGALDFATTIKDTDALITQLENVPLMLFYADCVPVMLFDPVSGSIGLAHAGWRGSVGDIAAATVRRMEEAYGAKPGDIVAGIGPSIGPCCFEVDAPVYDAAQNYQECFKVKDSRHWLLDLWQVNRLQLLGAGLLPEHILTAGICTYHNNDKFFSYRRDKAPTGRLAAIIMKKAK